MTVLDRRRVLGWRSRRQLLDRPAPAADPVAVVRRLLGVQAQVGSYAEHAVAARQAVPDPAALRAALAGGALVKTWSARGTLHLLDAAQAPAQLALLAATRTWEKGSWQKTFVTLGQLDAIRDAVCDALTGAPLTREDLVAAVAARTGDPDLAEHLRSGWGAVLKPLAWQGLLVHGPGDGNRVTFTRPPWSALPSVPDAARLVVPAYLGVYGPASAETFDQWLCRGVTKRAALRGYFTTLVAEGVLAEVEVDGQRLYARAGDVAAMADAEPFDEVRLLPAFDQFVLGPGTADPTVVPPRHRAEVSRPQGWISPVVAHDGRVKGVWQRDGGRVGVDVWEPVPQDGIDAELARLPG